MSQWPRIPLGEISESIDYGVTASASEQPLGPRFLRITDIQDNSVNWGTVPWCSCSERELESSRLKSGDIVFARTGATTGKSYLIGYCPPDTVFASYLIRVRPKESVEPSFISHFFQTSDYWGQITKGARGAAQPGVNATTLKALEIPLPPLSEQRRIAAILDQADILRAKRREALVQLDSLMQSVFIAMFGEYRTGQNSWPEESFEQITTDTKIGLVRGAEQFGPDFDTPYIRMNAIGRSGEFFPDLVMRTNVSNQELEEYSLQDGDFLFNTRNSKELVGKTALFREQGEYVYNNNLMRIRFKHGVEPEYVAAAFLTPYIQHELEIRKAGTTSVFAIYARELKSLPVPIPPLELQKVFSGRAKAIERIKSLHRQALISLDSLFASLQHRAFRGEL